MSTPTPLGPEALRDCELLAVDALALLIPNTRMHALASESVPALVAEVRRLLNVVETAENQATLARALLRQAEAERDAAFKTSLDAQLAMHDAVGRYGNLRAGLEALADEYEQAVAGVPRPNYAAKIHEAVAHDLRALLEDQ